jgi:hypothetical protein
MKDNLYFSEKTNWMLLLAGIVASAIFFYVFFYSPKIQEIAESFQRTKSLTSELKISEERIRILEKLQIANQKPIQTNKTREEIAIEAINDISKIVSTMDLDLLSIRPKLEEASPKPQVLGSVPPQSSASGISGIGGVSGASLMPTEPQNNKIAIELAFQSGYNEMYRFLKELDNLPILVMVDRVSMSKGKEGALGTSVLLSVYY